MGLAELHQTPWASQRSCSSAPCRTPPGTDRLTVDAAQIAKHYGAEIAVCRPRRAQRKGVVEAAIKYITKSW